MSQEVLAQVDEVQPLTNSILQVRLYPEKYIDYLPGQYLQILIDDQVFSYSIANAPLGSKKYELHIRHTLDNANSQLVLAEIKKSGLLRVRLPFGQCHLQQLGVKPLIFIAGGTGFAPIHAMIEQLLANGEERQFELYWGARSKSDLYFHEKVLNWEKHLPAFRYFSLLPKNKETSLSSLVIAQHAHDLSHFHIVLSGPFEMVYAIRDELLSQGAPKTHLFSDAFGFAREE